MRSSASSLSEEKDLVQKYIKETAHVVKPVLLQSTKIADSRIQQTIDYSLEYLQYFERSLLMRLSCESVGGQPHRVTDCAVSVELLHLSSLVIDDILDDAPSRSGKKSLYRKHGIGQAIITAEILTSFSLASFGRALERVDLRKIETTRAYDMWRRAYYDLYSGQSLDLYLEQSDEVSQTKYYRMASKTTSSLIKLSLVLGAMLAGAQEKTLMAFEKFGDALGKAFQLRDDMMDIIGEENLIGKPTGEDLRRSKKRLPVILALRRSLGAKRHWERYFHRRVVQVKDVILMKKLIIESGAIEQCKQRLRQLALRSLAHLDVIGDSRAKKALVSFAKLLWLEW